MQDVGDHMRDPPIHKGQLLFHSNSIIVVLNLVAPSLRDVTLRCY